MAIHQADGTFTIASRGMWLPGIYADERAARYAFRFSNGDLAELNASRGVGDDYQPITFEDLKGLRATSAATT